MTKQTEQDSGMASQPFGVELLRSTGEVVVALGDLACVRSKGTNADDEYTMVTKDGGVMLEPPIDATASQEITSLS